MTLVARNLSIQSDKHSLFTRLSFTVSEGEVMSVMGPSGCGKTSLLNLICGTLDSSFNCEGALLLDDVLLNNMPAHQRRIGLQFQDHLLFPHMTVSENLAFGLPRKYKKTERQAIVRQSLADCDLDHFGNYDPAALSGGQRARISLMRTLLSEPRLLLLDEPFSKLDTDLREQFRSFVFAQIKSRKIPALMVTHDPQDVPEHGQIINLDYSNS